MRVDVAHTADLPRASLDAAHGLLRDVFGDDLSDHDWEHALGGMHALVWDGDDLVSHGSVVQRRLLHGGRALRTGYVEGVATRPAARRRGHGAAIMRTLDRIIRGAYDLGALGATDEALAFYRALGWEPWRGPLAALTPDGVVATPDEAGGILVLPAGAPLDLDGELVCDWRDGDPW